jgi:hypothetical protein
VLQNVELQNAELQNAEFQNIELQNAELTMTTTETVSNQRRNRLTPCRTTGLTTELRK